MDKIESGLNFLRDKDIVYTCKHLETLSTNMQDDLGFTIAVMSSPLHQIPDDRKQDFWVEYKQLIKSFLSNDTSS